MTHDVNKQTFDSLMKLSQELRVYKRKHRREFYQKLFFIVCIILLLVGIYTGLDDDVKSAVEHLLSEKERLQNK